MTHKLRADVFQALIDACSYALKKNPEALSVRDYLDARLPRDLQDTYGFGYFPEKNLDQIINLVGRKHLEQFNLIYKRFSSWGSVLSGHFSDHNLIMPFRDVHGDIVSILGRNVLPSETQKELGLQKYKYTINADKELHVYGLDLAKPSILKKNYVICVEGQFDAIACHSFGITNAVALGWATLSKYQLYQISKYTDNIVLLLDNDEAGQKGKARAKQRYKSVANIKTMQVPLGYKDIDEFFKTNTDDQKKQDVIYKLMNLL